MRGSDGADSNFGEVGIFHTKIRSMSPFVVISPKLQGICAAVSEKDPKRVSRYVDQFAAKGLFGIAHTFTHH
jgi:hypothetical protein